MANRNSHLKNHPRDRLLAMIGGTLLLAGCSHNLPPANPSPASPELPAQGEAASPPGNDTPSVVLPNPERRQEKPAAVHPKVIRGTGQFVHLPATVNTPPKVGVTETAEGVTLDFANADIRDVVRHVLGDLLGEDYAIDPAVQGAMTFTSREPVPRTAVLAAFGEALRLNGVTLVKRAHGYVVLPSAGAARSVGLSRTGGTGYGTQLITLHNVSAAEIQKAIEPLLPANVVLRADNERNLLVVGGTEEDIAHTIEDVAIFDVDYLRGMSFALLPLHNAPAKSVTAELTTLLGADSGAMAGMVRLTTIDRLNAILVTSPQAAYLDHVQDWVDRLDQRGSSDDRRIFVYRVQNGRATDLAGVLGKLLGTTVSSNQTGTPSGGSSTGTGTASTPAPATPPPTTASPSADRSLTPDDGGSGIASGAVQIKITADEVNNALLVLASPQDYAVVSAALDQLDIPPMQVMIEATIAEVTLNHDLSNGLQYYFNSSRFKMTQSENSAGTVTSTFPGLNVLYAGGANVSVVLNLVESMTDVRVLSSPNLLVINNQTAQLQVGDQVPIATQSAVSTLTSTSQVINSIEYRDTGVILKVTPRVNAGGLVLLDVSQEVSGVSTTTTSTLNSPTITQRRVSSTAAVQDGQTVALGGLITDSRTNGKSGIPWLHDLPGVGWLFGTEDDSVKRTELLVLITPHVVRNRDEIQAVTAELRRKLPLVTSAPDPAAAIAKRPAP